MKKLLIIFLLTFEFCSAQDINGLFAIAGSPNMQLDEKIYPTVLYKIISKDSLQVKDTITLHNKMVTKFIKHFPEQKKVIILQGNYLNFSDNVISLIDYSRKLNLKNKEILSRDINPFSVMVQKEELIYSLFSKDSKDSIYFQGLEIPSLEIRKVNPNDFKNTIVNGDSGFPVSQYYGLLLKRVGDSLYIPVTANVSSRSLFPISIKTNYKISDKVLLEVNNNKVCVFNCDLINDSIHSLLVIYDKEDSISTDLILNGNSSKIKLFDSWIAGVTVSEASSKKSPGYANREKYSQFSEAGFDLMANNMNKFYPGILFIYNYKTGKFIKWRTTENGTIQADSEILFINDNTVYYRINNKIFKKAILNGTSLGPEITLIKNNMVPYVHWMFSINE